MCWTRGVWREVGRENVDGVVERARGSGDDMRLRATWVVEYEVDPVHYGIDDPREMAGLDQASDDPIALMADAETVSFVVEPVASEGAVAA